MKKFIIVCLCIIGVFATIASVSDKEEIEVERQIIPNITQGPKKEEEEEEEEEEELPLVYAFDDTQFGEGLEGYYGFTIVEQMNDGTTAWMKARRQFKNNGSDLGKGNHYLRLEVEDSELTASLTSYHNYAMSFVEVQTIDLGTIDPEQMDELKFLEDDAILEQIGQFIRDNLYEIFAPGDAKYHYIFAIRRMFHDEGYADPSGPRGLIDAALYDSSDTLRVRIENDVMTITSKSDDKDADLDNINRIIFDRSDSTVRDGEGNIIVQGHRKSWKDIYDGQIGFDSDEDVKLVVDAIEALKRELGARYPW